MIATAEANGVTVRKRDDDPMEAGERPSSSGQARRTGVGDSPVTASPLGHQLRRSMAEGPECPVRNPVQHAQWHRAANSIASPPESDERRLPIRGPMLRAAVPEPWMNWPVTAKTRKYLRIATYGAAAFVVAYLAWVAAYPSVLDRVSPWLGWFGQPVRWRLSRSRPSWLVWPAQSPGGRRGSVSRTPDRCHRGAHGRQRPARVQLVRLVP